MPEGIFIGSSEMGTLMRSLNWSQTLLGSVETWSQSLRTSISICLSSRFPILLWWGTDLVMFYNDAYRLLLGEKHPESMGQRGQDCWGEIWNVIGSMLESVLCTGEAAWLENQLLLLDRHGSIEECYFTFSYSPIADEAGGIGGVFTAATETTQQVIGGRRLQTLQNLAANTAKTKTVEETYKAAIATLADNPNCIPFALLYRIESDNQAQLVGATGLEAGTTASPAAVDLSQAQAWPFEQGQATGQAQHIENLSAQFGELFDKGGTTLANDALLLPLTQVGSKRRVIGFLVLGISSKLAFDSDYQSFFNLVARSVESAIANVEAYKSVRQSEEQLRLAANAAKLGLWHWDVQSDTLTWTDQCKALFGLPPDTEMSYPVFLNAIHPDDLQRVQNMRPVLEDGRLEQHEHECRTLWPDGTVRWLMARGSTTYDANAKPIFSMGVIFDITDRKQAEIAIREAEERLNLAVEAGRMIAWEWNPFNDSLITSANFPEIYGALDIHPVEQGIALLHPEDRSQHRAIVEHAVETSSEYFCEFRIVRPDTGATVWMEERAQPILNPDGTLQKLIGVSIDISERKRIEEDLRKSEQQLRSAIEVARFSPYEWNPITGELVWDAQLKAMWGLPPDAEVNLAVHNAGIHPEDREYVEQQAAKAIDPDGDGIFEAEFRVIGIGDGIERWVSGRGQTFFDAERRPVYYVGAAQDISDRKQAELEIQKFVSLADNSTEFIGMCDMNLIPFYINEAGLRTVGLESAQQFKDTPVQEFFFPEDQDFIVNEFFPCVLREGRAEVEIRFRHFKTGEALWMIYNVFYIRDGNNQPVGLATVSRNVTERKHVEAERNQAEATLRESEERFRTLAATVPQLLWTATPHGRVDYLSEQWADYIGLPPERLYDWNWQQVVHPDDLPNTLQDWQHSIQSGEPLEIQHRFRHHTGEWRWQLVRGLPVKNEAEQVTKWVGTCTDIHDSKLREQDAQFLSDLSEAIRTIDHADDLMTTAITMIGQYLQLKRCYFAQTDEVNDRAWIASDYHDSLPSLVGEHPLSHYPAIVLELLRAGQLYIANDNKRDPRSVDCYATVYEPLAIRAHVVVPFLMDGRWAVNLIAATDEPRQWQEREINLLETAAERIWLAVEKLRSEAALRDSEDRYRALTELSPQLVFMSRPDGFITYVNQWGLDFTGRSLSEFQGNGWAEFIHPEYRDRVYEAWMTATSNVSNYDIEIPYRRVDGVYRWLYNRALPVTNDASEIEYWLGVAIDITDRKHAEAALHESEERLRFAMEAAQMGSWDLDIRTGKLIWSEQYFKVLGYEPIETGEASYEMWSSRVHPDDREWVLQRWQQSKLDHQLYRTEYRIIRDDNGEIAWVASLGSFTYDETGQPIRALGVVFDITDRKQTEAALQESLAILNTVNEVTPTLIYIKDRQRRLQMVNPATARLLGKSEAELIGKTEVDYLRPEEAAQIAENDCHVMDSGQVIMFEELVVVPEGTRIFLSAKAPYRDEQGNIIGLIGVSTDITDRKQAEAEREQLLVREQAARETAEAANRIKDEFLAVLSHELRSPLNPILGWSRLLLNGKLDESKTKQALATIQRNAKLQSELIEDLLDVSRILQGKLSLTVSPINLASTIQSAIETVRLAAEAKSIAIKTKVDPTVGLVSGDSTRLQQIVWNLLSNAVKFTPSGGQVIVQLEQVNHHAQITVCDTGKGISADFLPYVFDYFRQADSTTTRKFGGLGLGLAIVRHLVELHGGTVRVDSPGEGQGATFTVRLPLLLTSSNLAQNETMLMQPLDLSGIRILVVDDEIDARELLMFLLEQHGAQVIAATSAHEALLLLTQSKPDILISDIGMPNMNGYMLMQQVRKLAPEQGGDIPAIALTAYAGELDQQQALSVGFQRHVSKPLEPEHLVRAILSLLDRPILGPIKDCLEEI